MEQAPKTNLSRPKLRNIALAEPVLECFFCGRVMTKKASGFVAVADRGVVFFACDEHQEAAAMMVQHARAWVERHKKMHAEEQAKSE